MDDSREYTAEEIREQFLDHIWGMLRYWRDLPDQTVQERLEGLAFSILVALDGGAMDLPAFLVAPTPHPDNKQYAIDEGKNYYPQNSDDDVQGQIAGGLHELFHTRRR